MKVRKAQLQDSEQIQKIVQVFGLVFKDQVINDIPYTALLEKNNEIIGVLITNRKRNTIRDLVIKKQHQRKGYGKKLFEKGVVLLNIKLDNMTLKATADPKKSDSVDFWKSVGFKEGPVYYTKHGNRMMEMLYRKSPSLEKWI